MRTIHVIALAALLLAVSASADTDSNTTTSGGKVYSYCKHTFTTEKLLAVRVYFMEGNEERRGGELKDETGNDLVWKMTPKTYVLSFRALTAPAKINGIRMYCKFQQPSTAVPTSESRETQPAWAVPIEVDAGTVLKMGVAVQEPAPGLRQVVIGGFR